MFIDKPRRAGLVLLGVLALLVFLVIGRWGSMWSTAALAHIILAVGVLPLMLGAMIYFTPVLTRSGAVPRLLAGVPFVALLAGGLGWLTVYYSISLLVWAIPLTWVTVAVVMGWMIRRASSALGSPHPGLYWYQAALGALLLGLLAILSSRWWPEQWLALRALHRSLNLFGFIGLGAVGTLQVLLPTVGRYADPKAGFRLRFDLKYAVAGSLLLAIAAAYSPGWCWLGAGLWGWVLVHLIGSWSGHSRQIWHAPGAALALVGAVLGLLGVVIDTAWRGSVALPLFVTVFLLPLVTGALSHLLPLWWWPGLSGQRREEAQRALGRVVVVRVGAFWLGGVALLAEQSWGVYPVLGALLLFLGQVGWILAPIRNGDG